MMRYFIVLFFLMLLWALHGQATQSRYGDPKKRAEAIADHWNRMQYQREKAGYPPTTYKYRIAGSTAKSGTTAAPAAPTSDDTSAPANATAPAVDTTVAADTTAPDTTTAAP
ncbi:uncharacterized protein DMAD_11423 [Drosophila madeirensis]|uniref:Uncharacterized protein n=1 Tax=Drosophila madeirensis TaxID=30013 RepID=A0AAU9FD72_DROMD